MVLVVLLVFFVLRCDFPFHFLVTKNGGGAFFIPSDFVTVMDIPVGYCEYLYMADIRVMYE